MTILVHLRNHIRKFSFSILETKSISTSAIKLNDKITNNSSKETKCCSKQKPPVVEIGQPTAWTHPHLFDPSKKDQVTPGLTKQEFEHRRDNYVKNLKTFQMHYFSSKLKELTTQNPSFIAIIPSAMTSFLAPDVPHMFKQNSDFLYLTGFNEPNSVLVFSNVDNDTTYKAALFVKERNAKTELWEGPCSGPENINRLCGIKDAYPINEFEAYVNGLIKDTPLNKKIALWRYPTDSVFKESGPNCENTQIENFLSELAKDETKLIDMMDEESINGSVAASYFNSSRYFVQLCRIRKSASEIDIMRKACEISGEAFKNSMNLSHPFVSEHLIHAKFDFDCKVHGAQRLAYIPVIAGGSRATILHYIRNNQIIENNSLVLMDAGCEYRDYASDITRTWPVNGRFTSAQKELYEACLNVQVYCIENCKPGITIQILYNLMMSKLGEELCHLGLIDKKLHENYVHKRKTPFDSLPMDYNRLLAQFCPHDIGHYLGLDVHDAPEVSKMLRLEPGCVITIEPGIYIRADNKNVPERYRGIGIRIEDDVAITDTGCEVLSKSIPKTITDIENLLKR